MKHEWDDTPTESFEAANEDGFTGLWARRKDQPLAELIDTPVATSCAREILKLAQREAGLLAKAGDLRTALTNERQARDTEQTRAAAALEALKKKIGEQNARIKEQEGAMAELWRLAQREADLLARAEALGAGDEREGRIVALRRELAALSTEAGDLRTVLTYERQAWAEERRKYVLWSDSARKTGERLRALEEKLVAEQRMGRQYCLELAEKAELIRQLQTQAQGHAMDAHEADKRARLLEDRLRARGEAILTALRHVEAASGLLKSLDRDRSFAGGKVTQEDLDWFNARNRLDLAREALAGAAAGKPKDDGAEQEHRKPESEIAREANGLDPLRASLALLEFRVLSLEDARRDLKRLARAVEDRLAALEGGRQGAAEHAATLERDLARVVSVLTAHGDRLALLEERAAASSKANS